ncbi:MAG: IS30 family transposase [Methanosarcinales archaeon]|nr:IS30 family transposase [Methanosarcinales archaeon]
MQAAIGIDKTGLKTNYKSIYQYIYKDKKDLIRFLPRRHRVRKKRGLKTQNRVGKILDRTSIENRPEIVNERSRFGDWEIDTMGSRKAKQCVQVIVEKKSRFVIISLLQDKSTKEMMDKAVESLKMFPKDMRKTITFDNGTENTGHMKLRS